MSVCVEHLTHVYMPDSPFSSIALDDVSVTIDNGEFIGLLGHTGSGKTTFVQHLNGLLKPTSGKVIIDGKDLSSKETSLMEVRRKVGLVFQYPEYQLFEETVAKDVAFGPLNLGLSQSETEKRVREAISLVGLDYEKVSECSPFELSGGQMRRVAIAGVLAMKPEILILDEPAAGLDPSGRRGILSMIRSLFEHGDLSVIMVSHSMDDIAELATRLIVMSKGKIVMDGVPRDIFSRGDALRKVGLGVPQCSELAHDMNEAGLDIPKDIYTPDEMEQAILRLWKGEKHSC